jgi:hypothetical protein
LDADTKRATVESEAMVQEPYLLDKSALRSGAGSSPGSLCASPLEPARSARPN